MRWLENIPIRGKLMLITMLASAIALLLAGSIMVAYDNLSYRTQKAREISVQAEILAASVTAALEFKDPKAAQEYLNPLEANSEIAAAGVYAADGSIFANYSRPDAMSRPLPARAEAEGQRFDGNEFVVFWPVRQGRQQVGTVYLRASTESLATRLGRYGGIILLVMVGSLFITLPISMRLHAVISNPIREIAEAASRIAAGDLTVSVASIQRRDELGLLSTKIAEMIEALRAEIAERRRAEDGLRRLNEELDQRVVGRTAQLETANKELEEQSRRVQKANQMKSEFLANMSHELRTPLNGVIGFSEFLADEKPGPLNAKQKEYLGDILNSGKHLLQLINDVLDLAKVEAGKMELALEEFSLKEAIGEVASVISPTVKKKGLEFNVQIEPEVEIIRSDRQKLKQILYNLLSNAVKFTDEKGNVQVVVRPHEAEMVRIDVKDTGVGIRKEDMGQLFVEFQQIDTGVDRRYQGTGLGLALTKRIVTLLNGRIEVDSQPGKGSTFSVILPRTC